MRASREVLEEMKRRAARIAALEDALRQVVGFTVKYHRDEDAEELLDTITTQFETLQETCRALLPETSP